MSFNFFSLNIVFIFSFIFFNYFHKYFDFILNIYITDVVNFYRQ